MSSKFENIYEPEEDSKLLLNVVSKYLSKFENKKLKVCEVGVGSGFISLNLAKNFKNIEFFGSDINRDAIDFTQNEFDENNLIINLKEGNLLEVFDDKFDVIFFNTPYLPLEDNEKFEDLTFKDKAIYGGEEGYEVILEFLEQIGEKLVGNGKVFMLFSSFSKTNKIDEFLKNNLYEFELKAKEHYFFEDLLVYEIFKDETILEAENLGVENLENFSLGKHSKILQGDFKDKKVIVKIGKEQHLDKEGRFLEKLQGESFVSKLLFKGNNYVIYEKVEGLSIKHFLDSKPDITKIKLVFNECIKICRRLDELGFNKFEMNNPYKHIFISQNNDVKMIDFERSLYNENPKNLTQFLQYIRRNTQVLGNLGIEVSSEKIFEISKKYSLNKNFKFELEDLIE